MPFDVRWPALINIAPCGREAVVKTAPRYLRKLRRGWRLNIRGVWMRTSCQGKRQQQHRHSKPFLHTMSSKHEFDLSQSRVRESLKC
jgi:hypothetical protein